MPEKKASDILLSLAYKDLRVWRLNDGTICVVYDGADIKDGPFLVHEFGRGRTFEEACTDYLDRIRGKTLVFNALTDRRYEVTVLG